MEPYKPGLIKFKKFKKNKTQEIKPLDVSSSEITTIARVVCILPTFLSAYRTIHKCDPNIPKKALRPVSGQQSLAKPSPVGLQEPEE